MHCASMIIVLNINQWHIMHLFQRNCSRCEVYVTHLCLLYLVEAWTQHASPLFLQPLFRQKSLPAVRVILLFVCWASSLLYQPCFFAVLLPLSDLERKCFCSSSASDKEPSVVIFLPTFSNFGFLPRFFGNALATGDTTAFSDSSAQLIIPEGEFSALKGSCFTTIAEFPLLPTKELTLSSKWWTLALELLPLHESIGCTLTPAWVSFVSFLANFFKVAPVLLLHFFLLTFVFQSEISM